MSFFRYDLFICLFLFYEYITHIHRSIILHLNNMARVVRPPWDLLPDLGPPYIYPPAPCDSSSGMSLCVPVVHFARVTREGRLDPMGMALLTLLCLIYGH